MTREERLELINHLKYSRSIGADYVITDEDADEIIKALERQSGTWKKDGYYLECSCCGYKIEADDLEMNNYCSACGAKMT